MRQAAFAMLAQSVVLTVGALTAGVNSCARSGGSGSPAFCAGIPAAGAFAVSGRVNVFCCGAYSGTAFITLSPLAPKLSGTSSRTSTSSHRAYCIRRLIFPRSR